MHLKKLSLSKETLRTLTFEAAKEVQGGRWANTAQTACECAKTAFCVNSGLCTLVVGCL